MNFIARNRRFPSFIFIITILSLLSLLASACQPLSLEVEQVSAAVDLMKVQAAACDYGGLVRAVEALDNYTVRFSLCSPDPSFPAKLAHPVFAIQDSEFLDLHQGDSTAMGANPNGSGPYRVKSYQMGSSLVLEPNPDYWGVPPRLKELVFRWSLSPVFRLADLSLGNVDGVDRPEVNSYYSISRDPNLKLISRPPLNVVYIGMNNRFEPFDDIRVRQGLSMMIDPQRILYNYYPIGSQVATQFLPPAMGIGYSPGYRWLDLDTRAGLQLLEEAGFDFDQTLVMSYSNASSDLIPYPQQIVQGIISQLTSYGIKVEMKAMTPTDFAESLRYGNEAFFLNAWRADYLDANSLFETFFRPDSEMLGDLDSDILRIVKEASSTSDPNERQLRYNLSNELIRLNVPAMPLVHVNSSMVFRKEIQGMMAGVLSENFEEIIGREGRLVFMQSREPGALWPSDETDEDTFRITRLLYSTLVQNDVDSIGLQPGLAESWESNADQTQWTFSLRYGVKFSNGAVLDANDVVASFAAMWDINNPNHSGKSGKYEIFRRFFGGFLNQAATQ